MAIDSILEKTKEARELTDKEKIIVRKALIPTPDPHRYRFYNISEDPRHGVGKDIWENPPVALAKIQKYKY